MAIFKILSGVALGTGAIVTAPVTAIGAIPVVAGYALHKKLKNNKEELIQKAKKEEQEKLLKELLEHNSQIRNITGLYIFGLAMANADNEISHEEEVEINSFIENLHAEKLPEVLLEHFELLRLFPPTFEEAVEKAINEYGCDLNAIDQLISVVADSDNNINAKEQEFYKKWEEYTALQK